MALCLYPISYVLSNFIIDILFEYIMLEKAIKRGAVF